MTTNRSAVTMTMVPSCDTMHANIMRTILQDMRMAQQQREWYRRANRFITRLAHKSGYSRIVVASLVAVLSPSVEWCDNRRMAIALLRDPDATTFINRKGNRVSLVGYGANIAKARMIIKHNDPSYCRGPKVVAFRDAILGTRDYAVVDVHATNIAMGTFNTYSGPANAKVLHAIALAYESVATELNWQVVEVQAAAWVVYKSIKPTRGTSH